MGTDKNVLELGSGDSCATLKLKTTELYTSKNVNFMMSLYLNKAAIFKIKFLLNIAWKLFDNLEVQ